MVRLEVVGEWRVFVGHGCRDGEVSLRAGGVRLVDGGVAFKVVVGGWED